MKYNFFITEVTQNDQRYNISVVIKDDPRYSEWFFHFKNIELLIDKDGVGVNYDLDIAFPENMNPVSEEKMKEISETGHVILEKIVSDMVEAINKGLDQADQEIYNQLQLEEEHETISP